MTDKEDKDKLSRTAKSLQTFLRHRTNIKPKSRIILHNHEDHGGWYSTVAAIQNGKLEINVFYDRWLPDKGERRAFWVGFTSDEVNKIRKLVAAVSNSFAIDEIRNPADIRIRQFDNAIVEYLMEFKGEDHFDCFGIYFPPGQEFDSIRAVRFLCDVLKTISGIKITIDDSDIDFVALDSDPNLNDTDKEMLRKARLGQGRYRKGLEELWGGTCSVLGLKTRELLRASHIKAWKLSNNTQRLDPKNGLLLSAHLDALFDKHLITFNALGEIIVSQAIPDKEKKTLGLLGLCLRNVDAVKSTKFQSYLDHHRSEFERKERELLDYR